MQISNPFGIGDRSFSELLETFSLFPEIRKVKVFGSRAMGNFKRGSDIDLCFWGDIPQSLLFKIQDHIEEKTTIPYLIDFVVFQQIDNKALIDHINTYGIEFYKKE